MKVILLTDVAKLGRKYETKEVSSGHAQNLLIPQGLAIVATPDAIKKYDLLKAKNEGERKVQEELLLKNIDGLDKITLEVAGKANEKGHLFAGLHREELSKEIKKQTQLDIDPSFIELVHPIKEIGEHTVEVKGGGKAVRFKLVVKAA